MQSCGGQIGDSENGHRRDESPSVSGAHHLTFSLQLEPRLYPVDKYGGRGPIATICHGRWGTTCRIKPAGGCGQGREIACLRARLRCATTRVGSEWLSALHSGAGPRKHRRKHLFSFGSPLAHGQRTLFGALAALAPTWHAKGTPQRVARRAGSGLVRRSPMPANLSRVKEDFQKRAGRSLRFPISRSRVHIDWRTSTGRHLRLSWFRPSECRTAYN